MKKFLYAAAAALALCGAAAPEAHAQAGVRVGPAADDVAAEAPAQPKPKKDAKAPASDAKKDSKSPSPEKPREAAKEQRKGQDPALSNTTAATVAPALKANTSSTSDAPSKSAGEPGIPVGSPVRTSAGAEGASDTVRGGAPANSGRPATPPNNPPAPPPAARPANASPAAPAPTAAVSPASIYRIGIGDVLDIRLLNAQDPRQNTLYSVVAGGVLDYPLLKDPLTVAGMTTDELSAQLVAEFRHRGVYDKPQVRVSVREYASHAVLVSGLVSDPGTKILRREAIPLYVVVAEAQPKPEAGRAVIISHSTGKIVNVDLNDAAGLNTLVMTGDVVTLTVRPPEFYYVGGEVGAPGQKDFHSGITLTQALLASGGATKPAGSRVRVLRAGADGRLAQTEYSLGEIENGVVPDPLLQPGDRVEVSSAPVRKR
jgi:protein involved in polysaccharide export with SLBB domain